MASTTERRPEPGGRAELVDGLVHVGEQEVGRQLDHPAAVDDEVLVGVRHAEVGRRDVAEDGPDEGCARPRSRVSAG